MKKILKSIKRSYCFLLLIGILLPIGSIGLTGCGRKDSPEANIPEAMEEGEKLNVIVTLRPSGKETDDFILTSSNPDVIKIEGKRIEALKAGSAVITVTSLNSEKEYQVTVKAREEKDSPEANIPEAMEEGEKLDVTVTLRPSGKETDDFILNSSNPDVIKIEGKRIEALKAGSTVITVTSLNSEKEYQVTVKAREEKDSPIDILLPEKIYANQQINIEVRYLPDNCLLDEFTIETSNPDVFEYYPEDHEGQAYESGKAELTVKAIYEGKEYELVTEIVVLPEPILSVSVPDEVTTEKPVLLTVSVDGIPVTEFEAFSSDSNIFKIEANKLIPLNPGKARLSVICLYDKASLSLSREIKITRFIPETLETNIREVMFPGERTEVSVRTEPSNTEINDFVLTSSNPDAIKIEGKTIEALKAGSTVIKVTSGEKEREYTVDAVLLEGIELEVKNEAVKNEVLPYKVIVLPSGKELKNFDWETSDDNIISLNKNILRAGEPGKATLKVSCQYKEKTYEASKEITVKAISHPVEKITVSGANGVLVGETAELSVRKYPDFEDTETVFVSRDPLVASVNGNVVTGIAPGKTVIVASVANNDSVFCEFEINVVTSHEEFELIGIYKEKPLTARYKEEAVISYNELLHGVIHTKYSSYTSTMIDGDVDGFTGLDGQIEKGKYYHQHVNILAVPSSKDIKIIPWANLHNHRWTMTTVRGLIEDFENKNPRYKVIAAINGDFFDIRGNKYLPYSVTGENLSDGEFYKTYNEFGGGGGTVGFLNDGSAQPMVAGGHAEYTEYMVLSVYNEKEEIIAEFPVSEINTAPDEGKAAVYYGIYNEKKDYVPIKSPDKDTWTVGEAELALPSSEYDFYGKGVISSSEGTELMKGQFAITSKNADLNAYLKEGVKIRIQRKIKEGTKFDGVKSAVGYNSLIYDEDFDFSQREASIADRAPRTVIGMREDGTIIMMVVDGRDGGCGLFGCDSYELAAIMKTFGCINAYNLDGGGSSTMVIRTDEGLKVMNKPSDGRERTDGNCILICCLDPGYRTEVMNITAREATIVVSTDTEEFKDAQAFIKIDNSFYPVIDGKAELKNLVHNSIYNYRVYYEEDGEKQMTPATGSFKTAATGFRFLGLTLEETDDAFIFRSYADDIDCTGNTSEMAVIVNDLRVYMKDGILKINKDLVGNKIHNLVIEYRYTENGENYQIRDEHPTVFKIINR